MNRQSNHSCIITMTILGLLVAAQSASAAEPTADLDPPTGTGRYVVESFSVKGAGPDILHVKASRKIRATVALAFPDDGIQIIPTENEDLNIIAANATGRGEGEEVLYVVEGVFVGGGGGQGQGGETPTWKAKYPGILADIQADADNDSTTPQRPPATSGAEREQEEVAEEGQGPGATGLIVPLNENYHEGGTGAVTNKDYEGEVKIVNGDPDLVQARLVLKVPDKIRSGSEVELVYDSNKLVVYKVSGASAFEVPSDMRYAVETFGLDNTLLIEGIAASDVVCGDNIQVILWPEEGQESEDNLVVTVVQLDVDIYSGSGRVGEDIIPRTMAPETNHDTDALEDEEDLGTFTVANKNNTNGNLDGNGEDISDLDEAPVAMSGSRGHDEVDLIQLRLHLPKPTDLPGHVQIQIVSGNVNVWPDPMKAGEGEITGPALTKAVADFGTNQHIDWYVQAREATALQGIKLSYQYRPNPGAAWLAPDRVTATGIWVEHAAPFTNPVTPPFQDISEEIGDNARRIWFRVFPDDIATGTVPLKYGDNTTPCRPLFDIAGQIEGVHFIWSMDVVDEYNRPPDLYSPLAEPENPHFPENLPPDHWRIHNEWGNHAPLITVDVTKPEHEVSEPDQTGYMYIQFQPSCFKGFLTAAEAVRANFKEFVRVRFDGEDPKEATCRNSGSRCSAYVKWHAKDTFCTYATAPPSEADLGHITFQSEALFIDAVPATTVGWRHHAACRGLALSTRTGPGWQTANFDVYSENGATDDLIDNFWDDLAGMYAKTEWENMADDTQIGDQLAYTAVGHFASDRAGEIVGPDGSSEKVSAELYHLVDSPPGSPSAPSTRTTVAGVPFPALTSPFVYAMLLGQPTRVDISGVCVESTGFGGGQPVTLRLIDKDDYFHDTLVNSTVGVSRRLQDEKGWPPPLWVAAFFKAGVLVPMTQVYIGCKWDYEIGGKDGWSSDWGIGEGEPGNPCEIFYDVPGEYPLPSPVVNEYGVAWTPPVATFSGTIIPVGGSITMTMDPVYAHSTGTGGTGQSIKVVVYDWNLLYDKLLVTKWPWMMRPANCFSGMLIGPVSTDTALHNTAHKVTAPGGTPSAYDNPAQIYYQINDDDDLKSSNTDIRAN